MPIDGILFTCLRHEFNTLLTNGRIQNVFQPKPDEVVFQIRQPGTTYRLLASIHPQLARVHLTQTEAPNPLSPPAFCLLLRKQLMPGRILGFDQPPYERSVTMRIETYGSTGERLERHVTLEIMGRHSNVVVVDASTGKIIDALKRIPRAINSYREILPHRPYMPPPPQSKTSPEDLTFTQFDLLVRHAPASSPVWQGIQKNVAGFSPFAAKELVARAELDPAIQRQDLDLDDIDRLWKALSELADAVTAGATTPTLVMRETTTQFWCFSPQSITGERIQFHTVNELLDDVYTRRATKTETDQVKRRLETVVNQRLARVERKIKHQQDAIARADRAEEFKRYGDLITANLYRLNERNTDSDQVTVIDYFQDEETVEIPVDPTLSANQNAQNYYKRYQKARKTEEKAGEQLRSSIDERDYLLSVQLTLDSAPELADLKEIEKELQREGYVPAPQSTGKRDTGATAPREPLRYVSSDGFTMLVGRNNRQNDEITLRRSRPDDLWFHTKQIPGAHVIVVTNNQNVPEKTLFEAGQLAAHHSKARMSGNVPVDYTRCKHVRKPKGAKPGMVLYEQEKTLWITPDINVVKSLEASGASKL